MLLRPAHGLATCLPTLSSLLPFSANGWSLNSRTSCKPADGFFSSATRPSWHTWDSAFAFKVVSPLPSPGPSAPRGQHRHYGCLHDSQTGTPLCDAPPSSAAAQPCTRGSAVFAFLDWMPPSNWHGPLRMASSTCTASIWSTGMSALLLSFSMKGTSRSGPAPMSKLLLCALRGANSVACSRCPTQTRAPIGLPSPTCSWRPALGGQHWRALCFWSKACPSSQPCWHRHARIPWATLCSVASRFLKSRPTAWPVTRFYRSTMERKPSNPRWIPGCGCLPRVSPNHLPTARMRLGGFRIAIPGSWLAEHAPRHRRPLHPFSRRAREMSVVTILTHGP